MNPFQCSKSARVHELDQSLNLSVITQVISPWDGCTAMGSNADKLSWLCHLSIMNLSQNAYTWLSWHFYMSQPD